MINNVVLVGRLTNAPEYKSTSSENAYANFTLALDNYTKNSDGTKSASFIPCVAFNQTADSIAKYTHKGSLIGIEGRLLQKSYQRQDGTKTSYIQVIADRVQFLEPKQTDDKEKEFKPQTNNLDNLDIPDDDLPF